MGRTTQRLSGRSLLLLCLLPILAAAQGSATAPGLRPLAPSAADGAFPSSSSGPVAAGLASASRCPLPALYVVTTLPGICSDRAFQTARAKFAAALAAAAGPGAVVRPRYIEDEQEFGARSVHSVVLFTGAGGWGQATWLRLRLEGNASLLFDADTFGAAYVRAVSAPYLALPSGETFAPAQLPPSTMASAMFSLAWPKDRAPASIGNAQLQAFIAALKTYLPGAVMHVTRHISECTCTSSCGRGQHTRRSVLAAVVAPSHYPGACPGRVVFNAVVASANRAQLAQLVRLVQTQPGAIWPQGKFGKLEAEGLSGIRLVPTQGYTSPPGCQAPSPPPPRPSPPPPTPQLPKPLMTAAQALGATTGTVTGAPRPGLTCKQYVFVLTPLPPSSAAAVTSPPLGAPTHTFTSLAASTTYHASVTCITPSGVRVNSSNTLPLNTPSASSFAVLAANPTTPTTATVLLGPLSSGKPRSYSVRACLEGAPANCKALQCTYVSCGPIAGLASGKRYTISANATLTSGSRVRASNTLVLAMPPAAAPVLLSAAPTSLTKGRATAVPPSTGACPAYFWVFAPLGSGAQVNATTTSLTITTATGSLVPGGIYQVQVACVRSGRAASTTRALRQVTLGPFSNALRFVMPAPGAPAIEAKATGATTATATVQPPPGFTQRFELTVCVLGGSCRKVPCNTPANCALTGLEPGATHSVTAVAFSADGAASAVSNAAAFTTPPTGPWPAAARALRPTPAATASPLWGRAALHP